MPAMKVVASSWLYCPLLVVTRASFAMAMRTCSFMVAHAVNQESSTCHCHVEEREKIVTYRAAKINMVVMSETLLTSFMRLHVVDCKIRGSGKQHQTM